jgi:hypothetical protein
MSDRRLTDEELDSLEHSHGMIESEYTPTCRSAGYGSGCPGATDDSLDFWRRAADAMPSMIAELRARRAADLTAEDAEPLLWTRGQMGALLYDSIRSNKDTTADRASRALSVLDRLIKERGK